MRPPTHDIVLTEFDRRRLQGLLGVLRRRSGVNPWNLDVLEHELTHAEVVAPESVPADVITMNSRVSLLDLDTGERLALTLAFPNAPDPDGSHVPVLSPMGLALLGCRAGHELSWQTSSGTRRLLIEKVAYQPEAAGHFFL